MNIIGKTTVIIFIVLEILYLPLFMVLVRAQFLHDTVSRMSVLFSFNIIVAVFAIASIVICVMDCQRKNIDGKTGWYLYLILLSWLAVPHYFLKYHINNVKAEG